jgi:hypothetical protein
MVKVVVYPRNVRSDTNVMFGDMAEQDSENEREKMQRNSQEKKLVKFY